jgi:hypothetical protein
VSGRSWVTPPVRVSKSSWRHASPSRFRRFFARGRSGFLPIGILFRGGLREETIRHPRQFRRPARDRSLGPPPDSAVPFPAVPAVGRVLSGPGASRPGYPVFRPSGEKT